MIAYGTVKPGSTLYIPFDSFAGSTGASVTITGLATSDIKVYKDGSTTERASASGFTLLDTDGIDFDSLTGIHGFSIDLADNTTAGFWAAGSKYIVVVSTITVDSQTVSFIAATFDIGQRDAILNTTIATLASQTSFTLTAGPAEDDALNGCIAYIHDVASAVQGGFAIVQDYTGSTKTVTLVAGTTFTAAATDNVAILAPALNPTVFGRTLDLSSGGEAGVDWANVGSQSTTVTLSGTTVKTATDVETDTADIQSRLPASLVGGRIDANMGAISSDAVAADNAESFFDGTGYAGTNNVIPTVTTTTTATNVTTVNGLAAGVITASSIAADAITDAKVASDVTIASVTGAVGSVTGNVGGNVTGSVGSIATGGIAAASFAAGAIDAAAIAADAIGASELAASAVAEIQSGLSTLDAAGVRAAVGLASANLDTQLAAIDDFLDTEIAAIKAVTDLFTAAQAEPSAAPAANATPMAKIAWLAALARNKINQTSSSQALRNDADSADIATASVTDNGTTFTRGEWT